jgi:glycosyltransferase involved in cell wall biosynthesis
MSIGGAQTHLVEVLQHLDRRRFTPLLCCLTTTGASAHLLQRVRELDVPLLDARVRDATNALGRPHTLRQMARVAGELRARGTQIVHSYLFHANWFGTLAGRLARVPVVIVSKRSMDVYARARDRWACRLVNRLADSVTAVAGAVRDHVHQVEGCPLEKIVVIPNGVRGAASTAGSPAPNSGLVRTSAADVVVGTITRLVSKRGHDDLLQAAALTRKRHPSARFVVIGDGPLRQALEEKARGLGLNGGVRFVGAVPEAARLIPQFDVFVLASLWEGMSNGLLEAMAAGRPVVATSVGGNPEVVRHGETGFLVPPGNPEAMADAIGRLLSDRALAQRLGEAGRIRAESAFTLEAMVARLEALYERLLAERVSRS